MSSRNYLSRAIALGAAAALAACSRDLSTTEPAPFPSDAGVFADGFSGVNFQAFGGSKLDAISVDATTHYRGTTSLKITVPAPGDPSGGYAGGALVSNVARDLSGYNAITFWAKASINAKLNVAGLGNDNTGTSKYTVTANAISLSPTWKKYTIPIPVPAKLKQERGMFYFAEGAEDGVGYDLWLDEIQFEKVATIKNPRATIPTTTTSDEVGGALRVSGTTMTFAIDGVDQTIAVDPAYFTFKSSNAAVAAVAADGGVSLVGAGNATITATAGDIVAAGAVTVKVSAPPAIAPPTPTRAATDVISLFSSAYTNVAVDTWSATWDQADVADVTIGGKAAKKYTKMAYAGVEFISKQVNASTMGALHLDVWTQDDSQFKVKLVDFGPNGVFAGGDDSEYEVTLSKTSTPALTAGTWSSLDIPISAFAGLSSRANLAQMIISSPSSTNYIANVYFYKVPPPPVPTAPTTLPPTPTRAASSVISLYSSAYTNVAVDTWRTDWSSADYAEVTVTGRKLKKYSNLVFAGIEAVASQINATAMTGFHMDIWTPDATALPAQFRVKIVDFGANGAFAGGDDVEHELTFTAATTPALATGGWVSLDVPLSAFAGLTTKAHIAQFIISGDLKTVFIDNVYFYNASSAPATQPSTLPAAPTWAASDAISLYSGAYTNVQVDTWRTDWSSADYSELTVSGRALKKYSNLVFVGVETVARQINATAMTTFHIDVWTPDPTAAPSVFRIKLVDFGADGAFGGGDDKEHELTFDRTTTPSLVTGNWIRFDIPLSAFTGLTTRGHLAQFIFSAAGDVKTVFIDNVVLHK